MSTVCLVFMLGSRCNGMTLVSRGTRLRDTMQLPFGCLLRKSGLQTFRCTTGCWIQFWLCSHTSFNVSSFGSPVPARKNRILGLSSDLVVSSDGNVLFVDSQDFKFRCPQYFEPDRQSIWEPFNCTMKFGSWTHNGWELNLVAKSSEADTGAYNAASSISVRAILLGNTNQTENELSCTGAVQQDLSKSSALFMLSWALHWSGCGYGSPKGVQDQSKRWNHHQKPFDVKSLIHNKSL